MVRPTLLKITITALTVCVIGGTPLNTHVQKRIIFSDALDTINDISGVAINGVKDWLSDDGKASDFFKNTVGVATDLSGKAINGVKDVFSGEGQAPDFVKDAVGTVTDLSGKAISGVQRWLSDDGQAPDFVKDTVDTITDLSGNAINGVQSWFSDDDQAKQGNLELGQEMIDRGKHLLALAANLSSKAYAQVNDPENRKKIKAALDSVTKAATDVVNAGHKVIDNKGKITAAMRKSFQDLSAVAKDSLGPLSDRLSVTKDSITKAGCALAAAGISAKDSAVALAAALREMVETSDLIAKANQQLEVVGKNLWDFGKGLLKAGRNVGKSITDSAKKVAKASGLWKPSD